MAVLYQKFRPQSFGDVVGQQPIVQTLRNAAENGDLAHAYLLTGSRGVGKTTLARILAKAANCANLKKGEVCGTCPSCTAITAGTSLDIVEIDAASHTGVDNVRELIDHAQFKPASLKTKVFIIDEVHMLSKAAFNALLKTLEEPPQHAMFILATTDIEKVPDTIISRTQRFDFKRIDPGSMTEALEVIAKQEKLKLPEGVLQAIVAQAEGSMRDALSKLGMVSSLSKITLEEVQKLLGITAISTVQELVDLILHHNSTALPDLFDQLEAAGIDAQVLNRSVLSYLRLLLNNKVSGAASAATSATQSLHTEQQQDLFASQSAGLALPQLLFTIRLFLRSYKEIGQSPQPGLPLLLAAIEASLYGGGENTAPAPAPAPAPATVPARANTAGSETPEQRLDTAISLSEVTAFWPEVINKIKVENSPLATLLKNSPVTDVSSGNITVAVKYLFHKENLDNKKHNALITESITEVSGKRLAIKTVIENKVTQPIVDTVDALSDALKVFGGELVE
jgi:DNA polymerase III subunit gamma/tau